MSRRLIALAVAATAVLTGAGCADDVSPAARIGSTTIGDATFLDEVDAWASNPQALDPASLAGSTDATYPAGIVRQLLTQRVDFEVHDQTFDDEGLELTEDLRDEALASLGLDDPARAEQAFAAWDDDFASSFIDDIARRFALQRELGEDGYDARMQEAYSQTDIEVNTRYGSWNALTRQVVAPAGPGQPAEPGDTTAP